MSSIGDADDDLVYELADEFVQRHQNGEVPSVTEYCNRHPELSDSIRKLFPTLVALEGSKRPAPTKNLDRVGTYELLSEIGRGGMGVVYEARHETLGRRVAVKVLPQRLAMDQRALARFHREARAIARLHHSNIVPLYDVGADEGQRYFAMQLIPGKSLDRALHDARSSAASQTKQSQSGSSADQLASDPSDVERRLSELRVLTESGTGSVSSSSSRKTMFAWVATVGAQIADAIEYAHEHGIIHRDVKPSNILIDDSGTAWLSDFGLAKTDDEELTQTGDFVGTVRYMSPERFRGQCDERADIYGLGLTLFEILAMQPAYQAKDRLSLLDQINRNELPALRDLNHSVPRDLETIIQKASDPDPRRRYQSAGALAEDLRNFVEDRPIRARRQSAIEKLIRWSRQNKGIAASMSTALLSLLVLVAVLGITSVREARLRSAEAKAGQTLRRSLYAAEMNLAGAVASTGVGLEEIDALTAKWLPTEQSKETNETDLRNWEWYYLRSLLLDEERTLKGDNGEVWSVEWNPEKRLIASSCRNGAAIWNAHDGNLLRELPHSRAVWRVVWSPNGNQLATSCDDGHLRVWDVATWSVTQDIKAHPGHIGCVDWSPDGQRLFSVSDRGVAQIWDVASGEPVGVPLKHEYQAVRGGTWSPDGRFVATATSQNDTIYLWDTTDTAAKPRTMKGHFSPNWLAWNSTGDRLASSGEKGEVMIWDIESGRRIRLFEDHVGEALRLSWSPDDRFVASASRDATVRVWDVDNGKIAALLRTRENASICTTWDETGRWLLAGCANGVIQMWEMETAMPNSFEAHQSSVYLLEWTPDGLLRSLGRNALKTWDLKQKSLRAEFRYPSDLLDARKFSPDASLFVARGKANTFVWSAADSAMEPKPHLDPSNALDESVANAKTEDRASRLSSLPQNAVLDLDSDEWRALQWSPDSSTLTIVEKGKRTIRSSRTMEVLEENTTGFEVDSKCFISKGAKWVIGRSGDDVHVLDAASLRRQCSLEVSADEYQQIRCVRFSADGTHIAGALDREVLLWDAGTGRLLGKLSGNAISTHYASYWFPGQILSWSPDGKRIATAGADGTIRIWATDDYQSVLTLSVGKAVSAVLWHPDGLSLIAGTVDGRIHIWDASRGYESVTGVAP